MMPRLQAERQQQHLDALVLAAGRQAKDETYRQHVRILQTQASGGEPTWLKAPKAGSLRDVAGTGIRVTREDRVAVSSVTHLAPGTRPGAKSNEEGVNAP